MTALTRRRHARLGTVLPAVLTALAGLCVALVPTPATPSSPARQPASAPVSWANGSPFGALDHAYIVSGGLHVWGWDIEPDAPTAPARTFATIDGQWAASLISDHYRPDVAAAHPNSGGHHGVGGTVRVAEGRHTVCIRVRNIGRGADSTLGCRTRVFDYGPIGKLQGVTSAPGALHVRGWAMDIDSPATALSTTITVDGVAHLRTANIYRTGLSTTLSGAGPDHGFSAYIPATQGPHTVCVTAHSVGYGSDNSLGCTTHTLDESPTGRIESLVRSGGALRLSGWAVDPDAPTSAATVLVSVDSGTAKAVVANAGQGHAFDVTLPVAEGTHQVCVTARNVSYGSDHSLGCRTAALDFTPSATLFTPRPTPTGVAVSGWATDPDTHSPIDVRLLIDGVARKNTPANGAGAGYDGHHFGTTMRLTSGTHTICAVGINVGYGTHDSTPACRTITLALSPLGVFGHLTRASGSDDLQLLGWALDPDTTSPITVDVSVDGTLVRTISANAYRTDVAASFPGAGDDHGISAVLPADDGEHHVCLTANNVSGGSDTSLGCLVIDAVHPLPPTAPDTVTATVGYGSATVSWSVPTSDGGAPWTKFIVTASPGGATRTILAGTRTATFYGLASNTVYRFTVQTVNVAGTSAHKYSAYVRTPVGPAPQRSPAPISTSRYIRNVHGSSSTDLAEMRAEGVADAQHNPSGHRYISLLDIGGQDQYDGGVVLSAGVRFVSYGDLVRDINAYVDGYHSAQRSTAPVVVALGTNNDMDTYYSSGVTWANRVVDPVRSHAAGYADMSIAGADDMEPGFRASSYETAQWLRGYLSATTARFVFNGSADGCAWTVSNHSCNNGWTMAGLYYLAGGAAPTRMSSLPQVYNTTMAAQWKYISLTGVGQGNTRINFGGPLTEYTACHQAGSCGSLGGNTAWQTLWNDLQSDSRLRVTSLPYSTDLRIDY